MSSWWNKKPQRKPWKWREYVDVQLRRANLEEREQRYEERLAPAPPRAVSMAAERINGTR